MLTVFTFDNLELVMPPTASHQYQSAENTQGFDFPVPLPAVRNDAIIDNKFTLNVNTDFTIDY